MTAPDDARVAWRYTFCDLATRRPLARLPLLGPDLQEVIGGPAQGSGTVPLTDDDVRRMPAPADPWTATAQRRTIMFAQRAVTIAGREIARPALWAGIVWKRERDPDGLALTMATPESYLGMRKAAVNRTFADTDDLTILRTVLADALAQPGGGMGGLTLPEPGTGTLAGMTVDTADGDSLLDIVGAITDAAGLEWRIAPGWDDTRQAFTLTLVVADQLGGTSRAALVWTSDPGSRQANEALGYKVVEDGTGVPNELTNDATVDGAGDDPDVVLTSIAVSDEVAQGWPLLQADGKADTKGTLSQARLDRLTAAELAALRRDEVRLTGLTVRGDRGPDLTTWGLGDTVTLRARDRRWPPLPAGAWHEVSGRVLGRRITPGGAGGSETVAMTLGVT